MPCSNRMMADKLQIPDSSWFSLVALIVDCRATDTVSPEASMNWGPTSLHIKLCIQMEQTFQELKQSSLGSLSIPPLPCFAKTAHREYFWKLCETVPELCHSSVLFRFSTPFYLKFSALQCPKYVYVCETCFINVLKWRNLQKACNSAVV